GGRVLPGRLARCRDRTAAIDVNLLQRAGVNAAGSLHPEDEVIGARRLRVVVERNGEPFLRLDQSGVHVALRERSPGACVPRAESLSRKEIRSARVAAHGIQVGEAISAIDIHPPCSRTDGVSRVLIPVALHRIYPAPGQIPILGELAPTHKMLITDFAVQQFSEQSLPHLVQRHQNVAEIADVLEHGMPVFSDVLTSSQHSSMLSAAGTSTPAYFPAFIAATATGVCRSQGVATITACRSSRAASRRKSSTPLAYPSGRLRPF